jgi:hypothetical protein
MAETGDVRRAVFLDGFGEGKEVYPLLATSRI